MADPASVDTPVSPVSSPTAATADSKDSKSSGYVATAMYPTKPTKFFVNIVDGAGNFATNESDISSLIENAQLKNDAYAIVGIMGCQSSGKSTLLNLLFGTKFREMDSKVGRSQTTLGVWMDAGTNAHNLVVMDLEGTDSTERGEDRVTFERQTCMFAMAMAEVLIVNMWEHDIGRYTASNIGILKTVFEVNLQLFSKTNYKTMLLFVIRDHIEEDTPMSSLRTKIGNEMNKIWGEVQKPEELKNAALGDFFVFEYVALPHMKLAKAKFIEDVGHLRDRFNKPTVDDYLFNTPWHGKKAVPSDGFPHYALQVWESIKKNQDMNLPSQKEMLATYRCDEISVTAFNTFKTEVQPLQKKVGDAYVEDFGKQATALLTAAMETFEKVAGRYTQAEVVAVKRKSLKAKICDELFVLFQTQMKHAAKQTVHRFNSEAQKALGKGDEPATNFYTVMEGARGNALKHFAKLYDTSRVVGSDWTPDEVTKDIHSRLDTIITQQRTSQLDKVTGQAVKIGKTELVPDVSSVLRVADDDMWPQIAAAHAKTLSTIANTVGALGTDFKCSAAEIKTIRTGIKVQIDELVRAQVVQHAELIQLKMRNKFEKLFRLDADGIQIRFRPGDDVRGKFHRAKDNALKLLELFGVFQLSLHDKTDDLGNLLPETKGPATGAAAAPAIDTKSAPAESGVDTPIIPVALPVALPVDTKGDGHHTHDEHATNAADSKLAEERRQYLRQHPDEDPHNMIIRPDARKERETEFLREINTILREAEDDIENRHPRTAVPPWLYGVLLVLGWDEFMAMIRNPFLMTLAIILGGGCFVIWKMGMAGTVLTAIQTFLRTVHESGVIGQTFWNFLKQFMPVEPDANANANGAAAGGDTPASPHRPQTAPASAGGDFGPSGGDLRSAPQTMPARGQTTPQHAGLTRGASVATQRPATAATPRGTTSTASTAVPAMTRTMVFQKVVVIDCAGHMLGRVASVIAKEVMNGQKIVAVRTEELNISGSLFRHKLIYGKFLIHRGNTNPVRGPNHYRSPSRILWRTVRGMMNHFKARGQAAMERLKVFEGCPHPYDKTKKVVIPQALRVLRLRPGRKYCRLGDLSAQVGWQHDKLIKSLEAKRKVKAAAWYQTKLQLSALKAKANVAADKKLGVVRPVKVTLKAKVAAKKPATAKGAVPAAKAAGKDEKKAAPAAKKA